MPHDNAVWQRTDKAGFVWRITICVSNGLTPRLEGDTDLLVIHSLHFRHRGAYCSAELDEAGNAAWMVGLGFFSSVKVSLYHSSLS